MMRRSVVVTLLMCAAVVVGCAGDRAEPVAGSEDPASSPAVAESCLAGATDCDDTPTTSPRGAPQGDEGGAIDEAAVIADAESLLGQAEEDALSRSDVRLERHGDAETKRVCAATGACHTARSASRVATRRLG